MATRMPMLTECLRNRTYPGTPLKLSFQPRTCVGLVQTKTSGMARGVNHVSLSMSRPYPKHEDKNHPMKLPDSYIDQSISHATLLPEHLFEAFLPILREADPAFATVLAVAYA